MFEQNFKSLERLWEAVSPDPCLYVHGRSYNWLCSIYIAHRRRQNNSGKKDTFGELSAKTRELIEANTTFMDLADSLPVFKIDKDYLVKLDELPTAADKAAALEAILIERSPLELQTFLEDRQEWIFQQLDRIERMQRVRRPLKKNGQEILFNGIATPVKIEENRTRRANKVVLADGCITIYCGIDSTTKPATSLENWLRRQAREKIQLLLEVLLKRISKRPGKVYVMGQRTKWGNCSSLQNLSFNWRLIMAPEYVVRYLVTHEAVHLEVPDHSKRFWLTVQSLCPEMDRARQWLSANSQRMMVDMREVCRFCTA